MPSLYIYIYIVLALNTKGTAEHTHLYYVAANRIVSGLREMLWLSYL
jgi:hypothetical protein